MRNAWGMTSLHEVWCHGTRTVWNVIEGNVNRRKEKEISVHNITPFLAPDFRGCGEPKHLIWITLILFVECKKVRISGKTRRGRDRNILTNGTDTRRIGDFSWVTETKCFLWSRSGRVWSMECFNGICSIGEIASNDPFIFFDWISFPGHQILDLVLSFSWG